MPYLLFSFVVMIINFTLVHSFSSPFKWAASSSPSSPLSSSLSSLWLTRNTDDVQIIIVESNYDILSLADLRYHEWMAKEDGGSHSGFRLATAEIYRERKEGGSTVFLASIAPLHCGGDDAGKDENDRRRRFVAVGSAELSPIELKGVFIDRGNDDDDRYIGDAMLPLYVTDVVTSKAHRRHGIGSILMNRVARTAWEMGSRILFLHVEYDNTPARTFYERMGYNEFTEIKHGDSANAQETRIVSFVLKNGGSLAGTCDRHDCTVFMDSTRLAFNAGTIGQVLLMKQLSAPPTFPELDVGYVHKIASKGKSSLSKGGFAFEAHQRKVKKRSPR
jgi:GNAT superfamily N-acetyltransferase